MNTAVVSEDVSERYAENNESQLMTSKSVDNAGEIPEVNLVIDSLHINQN